MPRWHRTGWMLALSIAVLAGCSRQPARQAEVEPTQNQAPMEGESGLADQKMAADAPAAPAARARNEALGGAKPAPGEAKGKEKPSDAGTGRYIIRRASVTLQVEGAGHQRRQREQQGGRQARVLHSDSSNDARC